MIRIRLDGIFALAPAAQEVYLRGFGCLSTAMTCFGISANANRAAHFLSQVCHESDGLRVLDEDLYYTTAARLMAVWPARFPTETSTRAFQRNPEALAEKVYGGRMGNARPSDGWLFRGRGPMQVTGHDNYRAVSRLLDVDFVAHPELVLTESYVWPVACAMWRIDGGNAAADKDDVRAVTRAINGGYTGLKSREAWLEKTRAVVETA